MKQNPDGPMTNWTDVLCAETKDNKKTAVLFSYAAHPVIVHKASRMITADFPGYAVKTARQELGNNVVCMFAQGCGGDINGRPWAGGFGEAEAAGNQLAHAAIKAASGSKNEVSGPLRCLTRQIQIPLRHLPPIAECEKVLKEWEARVKENPNFIDEGKLFAIREVCEQARRGEAEKKYLPFPIQMFAVGKELCIVGLPHEMFCSYQLWIDANSPFRHNMVFGYTNGCETYIGTAKDYTLGGYETAVFPELGAQMAYHYRMAPEEIMEKMIQDTLKEMFQQLLADNNTR
jgi:neutral ceramidase